MLLIHGSVKNTAAVCNLSENAIYRRLQDPELRKRYDALQGVMLSITASTMTEALQDAVQCLKHVINDPEASCGVRVSASDALLRHCCRYVETANILQRLDKLEAEQGIES